MRIISFIIVALIIIIGFTFACLNAEPVAINYYLGSDQLPLSLLLAIAVLIGGLFGLLVGMKKNFRLKHKNFRLQQSLKRQKKFISNLEADL